MRIAYVYDAVYPDIRGGAEKRIWEIARRLAQRGHDVHIFGMKVWKGDATTVREGVILHGISRPFQLYRKGKRRIFPALIFGVATFFALARERFDIVDCQQFPYISALSGMVSCRLSGSPFLITWHELWSNYWYDYLGPIGAGGKVLERFLARSPAPAIVVSETTGDGLAGIRGRQDTALIPNGVDLAEIDAIPPSPVSSDILFAGRLITDKHVDILIEAVGILREQDQDIRCLIIGDGPEREKLEEMVHDRNLRSAVMFTGFLPRSEDVIGYMKSSRVFVFPSTREGFGMAVLEALGCGRPVVTIDHPKNAARFLVTEDCGALCALDARDLSITIRTVLGDPEIGGNKSRRRAQQYDWGPITGTIEEYYLRISEEYRGLHHR